MARSYFTLHPSHFALHELPRSFGQSMCGVAHGVAPCINRVVNYLEIAGNFGERTLSAFYLCASTALRSAIRAFS